MTIYIRPAVTGPDWFYVLAHRSTMHR